MIKIEIPDYVRAVMAEIRKYNPLDGDEFYCGKAYIVGGCVRDAMLGSMPNDWDVTTNCKPNVIMEIFSDLPGFKAIPTGIEHGTVTVVYDGKPVEVTTFRSEQTYVGHRFPVGVNFHDCIDKDLERRDFTINAMAYSDEEGVIDLHGGMDDIETRLIRCVGNPKLRFNEDALRILRALRFSSVLDFDIEKNTADAAIEMREFVACLSAERITAELSKLLMGKRTPEIITRFAPIFVELFPVLGEDDFLFAGEYMKRLEGASLPLMYAALISDVSRERLKAAFFHLRLDNKTRQHIENIILHLRTEISGKADLKRLIRDVGAECASDIVKLGTARFEYAPSLSNELSQVLESGECCSRSELMIDGNQLLSLGAEPKTIGGLLDRLLDGVISEKFKNDRGSLERAALEMINRKETT